MPYKDVNVRKNKHKEYSRKHYEENREEIKQKTKDTKAQQKIAWHAFKSTIKCEHCGFFHIAAMDFHHVDPSTKEDSVWRLINNGQFAKAYEEVKKCIVLCANCHRIHHHEDHIKKKNPTL